jgi:hypothetical protein
MVLRYKVSPAVLTAVKWKTVPLSNPPFPKTMSTNGQGITITSTDSERHLGTSKSDDVSVMSINDRNKIFHISHHVLFPEVLDEEGHQSTDYSLDCKPSGTAGSHGLDGESKYFETPDNQSRSGHSSDMVSHTGTGDCHASQMSINDPVQSGVSSQ